MEATLAYFKMSQEKRLQETRRDVFCSKEDFHVKLKEWDKRLNMVNRKDLAMLVDFYDGLGKQVKCGYLPLKVFDGAQAVEIIRLYEKLRMYMFVRSELYEESSPGSYRAYGNHFTLLYERIKKRHLWKIFKRSYKTDF